VIGSTFESIERGIFSTHLGKQGKDKKENLFEFTLQAFVGWFSVPDAITGPGGKERILIKF
jgi:hypothetical protein